MILQTPLRPLTIWRSLKKSETSSSPMPVNPALQRWHVHSSEGIPSSTFTTKHSSRLCLFQSLRWQSTLQTTYEDDLQREQRFDAPSFPHTEHWQAMVGLSRRIGRYFLWEERSEERANLSNQRRNWYDFWCHWEVSEFQECISFVRQTSATDLSMRYFLEEYRIVALFS